jgi:hypothetical protein
VPRENRDEFERRLLALLRSQLDILDRDWPNGWDVTDFVVTVRFYTAPEPGAPLDPWAGGPYPGWMANAFTRGSSTSYFVDAELLQAALDYTRDRIDDMTAEDYEEGEDESDEADRD